KITRGLQADVSRDVVLPLASKVLQESIERYRKKNQNAVIARAGELFALLTAGSFERLEVEIEEGDKPVLYGVRARTRDKIGVEALSEGSCDQLYLALRLATVEEHLKSHEPIPFIVDDILLNFDNERATAALRALAELSSRTQVLFFTHHQHLVDLAKTSLAPDVCFVHT